MTMNGRAVVSIGGGPPGLMPAGELAGVDVAIVERRPNQDLAGAKGVRYAFQRG
jgi:3-(3-hydroxy-phenyl)propionate hydroxylase